MDLPLISACFLAFALTMYVLLDGFDLGVGILLLFQRSEAIRNHMADSITPTWDGNETWLIMAAVTLFAAFPLAYGVLLPAFYLPVVTLLLALGLRGVTFEFRVQRKEGRWRWDLVFGVGSLLAAFMQGCILGGLIQGITIRNNTFAGDVFHWLRPLPLLCGTAVACGYIMLGAAWLYYKSVGTLQDFAARVLRRGIPGFLVLFAFSCALSFHQQQGVLEVWRRYPLTLLVCCLFMAASAMWVILSLRHGSDRQPLSAALVMIGSGMAGLATLVFPDVVPFRMTIWEASASRLSQIFILSGVGIVCPVVIAYSAYAYWVFRGKTPEEGWES